MTEIFPFFIVLLAGLVFSQVFQRFHVPWTITLIISGIIIGPYGLGFVAPDVTLDFLKYLGLVFLMFMAGLETRLSGFRQVYKEASFVGFLTAMIPFVVGISIGLFFGYGTSTTILLGLIFMSSSIAIAIPTLESKGLFHSRIGKIIISSIVLQDVASLILLAVVLQYFMPGIFPLPIFVTLFLFALLVVALVRWGIPRLRWVFDKYSKIKNPFERDLRMVFAVLIGAVIIFELLGLHAIVGAFLAGLVLSETIKEKALRDKIHVMAYGLFIPIFFVMVGADTDISVFWGARSILFLFLAVVLGSILSKFLSGYLAGKLINLTTKQSMLVGGSCIPQLSTTLAVIAVGQQHHLLPSEVVTTLILLSIITVLVSPLLVGRLADGVKKTYFVTDEEGNV